MDCTIVLKRHTGNGKVHVYTLGTIDSRTMADEMADSICAICELAGHMTKKNDFLSIIELEEYDDVDSQPVS